MSGDAALSKGVRSHGPRYSACEGMSLNPTHPVNSAALAHLVSQPSSHLLRALQLLRQPLAPLPLAGELLQQPPILLLGLHQRPQGRGGLHLHRLGHILET